MKSVPLRRLSRVLRRMSPLQRDVASAMLTDDWNDDGLAEHHVTTPGAVRIERGQARQWIREALERDLGQDRP